MKRQLGILVIAIAGLTTTVYAQVRSAPTGAIIAGNATAAPEPETRSVRLLVGRSTIVDTGTPITRVSLTSPDVADALVTKPSEILINGKTPGTISMFVWDRGGAIQRYELNVQRDVAKLAEQVRDLFPDEGVLVTGNGKNVVLSGSVSNKDIVDRVANLAMGFVDKKEEVVNLLQLQAGAPSNQVLLRVRFAEVSRSAMTELGVGLFTSPTGIKNTLGRSTTQQFPAPGFDELQYTKKDSSFGGDVTSASGKFTFSDFLNLFVFSEKYDLGAVVKALQTRGMFQSLAEPNLITESGKEASFLAGGEFPVPVAQASGGGTSISIIFKEFGIRLNFTPVVSGNRVHLKVKPEVSSLDFANAIQLNGFRIPALSTRRTETEIELENHQTFAIAGLLNNTMSSTLQKIPGIGDIPILGLLFKSKSAQKNQTELVIMITPEILPIGSHGVTPNLPRQSEPYLPPLSQKKSFDAPPPAFQPAQGTARTPASTPVIPAPASPNAPASAAAAAAAVKALTPTTRPVVKGDPATAAGPGATSAPAAGTPAPLAAEPVPVSAPAVEPAAAQPTTSAPAATPTVASTTAKPTAAERQALERAREDAKKRNELESKAHAAELKQQKTDAEAQSRRAKADQEAEVRAAREQAKRDEAEKKREAELAKKHAEVVKEQQRAIAEADAKVKAAQAAYDAELARTKKAE